MYNLVCCRDAISELEFSEFKGTLAVLLYVTNSEKSQLSDFILLYFTLYFIIFFVQIAFQNLYFSVFVRFVSE